MPAGSDKLPSDPELVSRDAAGVSMITVPGWPGVLGGSYEVTGAVITPGPGYSRTTVIFGLPSLGGIVTAAAEVGWL